MVFEVDDVPRLRQRLRRHRSRPGVSVGSESRTTLLDTYFDTADWSLRRAGCALRLRRVSSTTEATLELLGRSADGPGTRADSDPVYRRRAITERLSQARARAPETFMRDLAGQLRGAVGTRVHAVIGRRQLVPLFEVTTERHAFPLQVDGMPAGEILIDDAASARGRRRRAFRLRRLQFAVKHWAVGAVEPLVALLTANPPLAPVRTPDATALLAAHNLRPAAPTTIVPDIADTVTVGEAALAAVARQLDRVLALEPATRLGEDREALHDMRVATRRLRALLRLFRPALSVRADRVREELRIVAAGLGRVRDLDVQLEAIERYQCAQGATDVRALQSLVALLHRRRAAARQHMLRILDSRHYRRAVDTCRALVRHGPLKSVAAAHQPILAVAPRLIDHPYRKFRTLGDRITRASRPDAYHALRIWGKRLRYAVEVHADIYGKPARAWLRRLVELLRLLGEHQDDEVASAFLRELGRSPGRELPARALVPVGRLAGWHEERARRARHGFPQRYRKTIGKRLRRLRRTMDERAAEIPTGPARPAVAEVPTDSAHAAGARARTRA